MSEKNRMSAAEFQAAFGSGIGNQDVSAKKPAIRLPKLDKMTKTEREYERILQTEFPASLGYEVKYEAISFKLDGGLYSPDFSVWTGRMLVLCVETKGSVRLGSASRSHMAFRAARKSWPHIKWRFAQWTGSSWTTAE